MLTALPLGLPESLVIVVAHFEAGRSLLHA